MIKSDTWMVLNRTAAASALALLLGACAPAPQHTMTIAMPEVSSKLRLIGPAHLANLKGERVALTAPKSYDDFNCFAINVMGPGISKDSRSPSFCPGPETGMGKLGGMAAFSGGSISVSAPEGKQRTIQLLGIMSPDGTCPSFDNLGAYIKTNQAAPNTYSLGSTTTDLLTDVVISLQAQYDPAHPVEVFKNCDSLPNAAPVPSATPSPAPSAPPPPPVLNFTTLPDVVLVGATVTFVVTSDKPITDTLALAPFSDATCSSSSLTVTMSGATQNMAATLSATIATPFSISGPLEAAVFIKASLTDGTQVCSSQPVRVTRKFKAGVGAVTFGPNGAAGGMGSSENDVVNATLVDLMGRIYMIGSSKLQSPPGIRLAVWRYNPDGTPDTTFNLSTNTNVLLGGTATAGAAGGTGSSMDDEGYAAVFDPQGNIVIAGKSNRTPGTGTALAVWRVTPSGTFDANFNSASSTPGVWLSTATAEAIAASCTGSYCKEEGRAVAIVPGGGDILIGGQSTDGPTRSAMALWRLKEDGSGYRTSFNTTGTYAYVVASAGLTGAPSIADSVRAVAIDGPGNIIAAGLSKNTSAGTQLFVARFTPGATVGIDPTFNSGTIYTSPTGIYNALPASSMDDEVRALQIDVSGKIVFAGISQMTAGYYSLFVSRLNTDGSLDATGFGSGGRYFSVNATSGLAGATAASAVDVATTLQLTAGGGIVVGGKSKSGNTGFEAVLVKLTSAGVLDTLFGGGTGIVDLTGAGVAGGTNTGHVDVINSCVVDPISRIICGGTSLNGSGGSEATAWRFNPNGSLNL